MYFIFNLHQMGSFHPELCKKDSYSRLGIHVALVSSFFLAGELWHAIQPH